jgi:uncharacterized protein
MFFLFFILIFIILWAAHGAVYYFIISSFALHGSGAKIFLGSALFVLSVSFVIAAVLVRWHDGFITRLFYLGASVWLGVLINLLLFIGLAGLISVIGGVFGHKPNPAIFGVIVLTAVVFYSGYGVWSARHPQVKELSVAIKNLPAAWKGRTAVQLSDVHLGAVQDKDYLSRLADRVNALHPDIIFITGDLFDGMAGDLTPFIGPLNLLEAPEGVYFVSGNHEMYSGIAKAMAALERTNIRVLDDDVVNIDGLQIIGASYVSFSQGKDVKKTIEAKENFDKTGPSIMLFHAPTDIGSVRKTDNNSHADMYFSSDTSFSAAKDLGVGLQLSGHTHKGQVFPFGFVTGLIYRGYDYGLRRSGDLSVYTSSGTGVWGPTMRTSGKCEIVVIRFE